MTVGLWVALFMVGLFLIAADFFVPSGGLLSILGIGGIVTSLVMIFIDGHYWTGGFLVFFGIVAIPLIVFWGLNRLTLKSSLPEVEGTMKEMEDPGLIGAKGVALTPLRPSGSAEIGDRRRDVVAEGGFVEPGGEITVVHVEGNKIVVRKAE